jgi:tetratricopeptide (TPR) repeat protein
MLLLGMAAQAPAPAAAQPVHEEPAWVYTERGDRLRAQGKLGEAIAAYRTALIRKSVEKGPAAYPEVHLELAEIYREQGLYDLALRHIKTAENQREFLLIPDLIYRIWYTKADIHRDQERVDRVLEVYERIIQEDNEKNYFFNRPLSRLPGVMIREFRGNRELRAKFGPAYYRVGAIKYRSGSYEAAEPYLRMAFLYGFNARTTEYLLDYYRMSGRRADYEKVQQFTRQP